MSESALPENRSNRNPFAGVVPILVALALTAVYFRVPRLSANWTVPGHILYRGMVVAIGLSGIAQLIGPALFSRRKLPSWLRLSQHWMTIPLEGWIYLGIMFVLFTGAMLTKQNTLLLVFAFMAGPFVINGWMTFGMLQAARVQRQTPPRAMQGELLAVEVTLTNGRVLFAMWMMSVRDRIERAPESLEATVLFSRVTPRTSQSGQYQLRLAHRGRYRFGPLQVASRFPLGLVERSRTYPSRGEILIYPRIGRISPKWRRRLLHATELVSRTQPTHGVFHDDFHRLREFRSGDNPRAIHWRSTARRGELILREFQQSRDHTLAILLDLYRPTTVKPQFQDSVEYTLSFIATLLVERGRECRDGYLSLAASGDRTFRWEGQGNAASLEPLFDQLATFEAGPSMDVTELLKELVSHQSTSTQILVVTTRDTPPPYQALLSSRIDVLNLYDLPEEPLLIF